MPPCDTGKKIETRSAGDDRQPSSNGPACGEIRLQGTEQPTYRHLVGTVTELALPTEASSATSDVFAFPTGDRPAYAIAKRAIDVVGALALLVLTVPFVLIAAIATFATSGRPIFYRQIRAGRHGVPFFCWKLRTMIPQAEMVLAADALLSSTYMVNFKIEGDPRITRVGRILRKTSIDELPQLYNVLRGEMSLVGPRPVTLGEFRSKYAGLGPAVFSVRPGLTGLWQVSGRTRIDYDGRIALDLEYLRTRSVRRDLWILLLTPLAILRGGA
jgi:exopolysaccharide production protein ExoY